MRIPVRPFAVLDIESYRNYFLLGIKAVESRKFVYFEKFNDPHGCDVDTFTPNLDKIRKILRANTIVTFNGNNYDAPILALAMSGASPREIKEAGDKLIVTGLKPWQFRDLYEVSLPGYVDHIDLAEVVPGVRISLKKYGGRLGSKTLQDLPIEPDATIYQKDRRILVPYNGNDLDTTIDVFQSQRKQLDLRVAMSKEYDVDMRSKSDAQVAEAVFRSRIQPIIGSKLTAPKINPGTSFSYRPPSYLQYSTQQMREVLEMVKRCKFEISASDKIIEPKALSSCVVSIGNTNYKMGIGGLHSMESCVSHLSDDEFVLIDRDVASYYPAIIKNLRLAPKNLGDHFLRVYSDIIVRRIGAKKSGDKVTADALKITLNGSFGKFGSKWSFLYAPDLLIQTTVTGQLALLMLIETLELAGIPVVSGNTDGIVIKCPRDRQGELAAIVFDWEMATGFSTEETRYRALYSRDVNNYIAIYEKPKSNGDGSFTYHKGKGVFAEFGITKDPSNAICVEAAAKYLIHGHSIESTVRNCDDIRKFVVVRACTGGAQKVHGYRPPPAHETKEELLEALGWKMQLDGKKKRWFDPAQVNDSPGHWEGFTLGEAYKLAVKSSTTIDSAEYLGKVVRWYRSTDTTTPLVSVNSGDKVAGSDCAAPVMRLPDELPDDLDLAFYEQEAHKILREVAAV